MRKATAFALVLMLLNILPAFAQDPEMISTSDTTADWFGSAVASTDKYLIVGAPLTKPAGAAYVFHRLGEGWIEKAKLIPSDRTKDGRFGWSVAISGDYAAIAASSANVVYVYKWDGNSWVEKAKLHTPDQRIYELLRLRATKPPKKTGSDFWLNYEYEYSYDENFINNYFGSAVAIDGDWIVVGQPFGSAGLGGTPLNIKEMLPSGSVFVFRREGEQWNLHAELKADKPQNNDQFGDAVAIFGERVIIGAKNSDREKGVAKIFLREGDAWKREALLKADGQKDYDHFGASVAISDQYAVIGAPDAMFTTKSGFSLKLPKIGKQQLNLLDIPDEGLKKAGAAYVFSRANKNWKLVDKLVPNDPYFEGNFGYSCAIEKNRILVGKRVDRGAYWNCGLGYIFEPNGTAWEQKRKLYYFGKSYEEDYLATALNAEWAFIGSEARSILAYSITDLKEIENVEATRQRAIAFYTGVGDSLKMYEAREIFIELARAGDPLSYAWACLINGFDIPPSVYKEVETISKSGDIEANFLMGWSNLGQKAKSRSGFAAGSEKNLSFAAEQGYPIAMYTLAEIYLGTNNVAKGVELHRQAVDAGLAFSMHRLGLYYFALNDHQNAFKYFDAAVKRGFSPSVYYLAELYAKGMTVKLNYAKAIELYEVAASFNDQKAAYSLGEIYYEGKYTQQDLTKAFQYFHKAAQLKDSKAMFVIGYLYEKGQGVNRDIEEAKTWYWRAGRYGYLQGKLRYYELDPAACSICKGHKKFTCGMCGGEGVIMQTHQSDDGAASYNYEKTCDTCGGDGIETCWNCTAFGSIGDLFSNLFNFRW